MEDWDDAILVQSGLKRSIDGSDGKYECFGVLLIDVELRSACFVAYGDRQERWTVTYLHTQPCILVAFAAYDLFEGRMEVIAQTSHDIGSGYEVYQQYLHLCGCGPTSEYGAYRSM